MISLDRKVKIRKDRSNFRLKKRQKSINLDRRKIYSNKKITIIKKWDYYSLKKR